jgi:hypothetical protein
MLVLSTFHHTLAYSVADGNFRSIPGACGGGVGAMTLADVGSDKSSGGGVVLLGRYSGEESVYGVYDLDVSRLQEARTTPHTYQIICLTVYLLCNSEADSLLQVDCV